MVDNDLKEYFDACEEDQRSSSSEESDAAEVATDLGAVGRRSYQVTLHHKSALMGNANAAQSVLRSPSFSSPPQRGSSYVLPSEAYQHAIRFIEEKKSAVLIDALCAVRQTETCSFEYVLYSRKSCQGKSKREPSGTALGGRWRLRKNVKKELQKFKLLGFMKSLESLLEIASDLASLKAENQQFHRIKCIAQRTTLFHGVTRYSLGEEAASEVNQDGTVALGCAAFASLSRFSALLDDMMEHFFHWILQLLESLQHTQELRTTAPLETILRDLGCSASNYIATPDLKRTDMGNWADCLPFFSGSTVVPNEASSQPTQLWEILLMMQNNTIPLRRWLLVLRETKCFTNLFEALQNSLDDSLASSTFRNLTAQQFATICAKEASVLLDYLVVRASSLQDVSSMDLYRCYMVLVVHISWPYFDLCTATMYGLIASVDVESWRQLLPRMFRVSFSHLRVSGPSSESPTDVLSLLLNCMSYQGSNQIHLKSNFSLNEELPALFSARRFIVQSFGIFCRRKKQLRHSKGKIWETSPSVVAVTEEYPSIVPLGFVMLDYPTCKNGTEMGKSHAVRNSGASSLVWCLDLIEQGSTCDIYLGTHSVFSDVEMRTPVKGTDLWINTYIPAARWLTAALLVPFGITVQQLQRRRLKRLFSIAVGPSTFNVRDPACFSLDWQSTPTQHSKKRRDETCNDLVSRVYLKKQLYKHGVSGSMLLTNGGPKLISFKSAIRLVIDVALCYDYQHIVDGFLLQLYSSGRWWERERSDSRHQALGTSSLAVSSTFAEAIRGIPNASLVQLVVLPLTPSASDDDNDCALHMFASFQLQFAFPSEMGLILFPSRLSQQFSASHDGIRSAYTTLFWQHRRGEVPLPSESLDNDKSSVLTFADVWSYAFGYLCSLHYSQIALRTQRKTLQILDSQAHVLERTLGKSKVADERREHVSRGLGSMFFSLSFVLDNILGFTLREVHSAVYELEHVFGDPRLFDSCTQLCQRLDQLLLNIQLISFPVLRPFCSSKEELLCLTSHGDSVRNSITDILYISLDPSRFPPPLVSMRLKRAVEAITAVISNSSCSASIFHTRLKPLGCAAQLVRISFSGIDHSLMSWVDPDVPSFSDSSKVLLRTDVRQFTPSELTALCQLDLPDPDMEEVIKVLGPLPSSSSSMQHHGGTNELKPANESPAATRKYPKPPKQLSRIDSSPPTILADFILPRRPLSSTVTRSTLNGLLTKNLSNDLVTDPRTNSAPDRSSMVESNHVSRLGDRTVSQSREGIRSLDLVFKLIPRVNRQGDTEAIAETILQTHYVEFIDYGLKDTLPVETFLNATHVYLQHNMIEQLDGLQLLSNLKVLVVHHNRVRSLQPLGVLNKLSFLDARSNNITHVNFGWDLPECLTVLDLRENPCCPHLQESPVSEYEIYRKRAISIHPKLIELNGKATREDGTSSDDEDCSDEGTAEGVKRTTIEPTERTSSSGTATSPKATKKTPVSPVSRNEMKSSGPTEGLVSTPPESVCEGGRRSPGVSRGLHKRLPQRSTESEKKAKKSTAGSSGTGKRQSVVDKVKAVREVKFSIPELPEKDESSPRVRKSEHIPYPVYDTGDLKKALGDGDSLSQENLTAPIDKMLAQYKRRSTTLLNALQTEAMTSGTSMEQHEWTGKEGWNVDSVPSDIPDEIRLAQQVRDKTRMDLDYAFNVLGHQSRRAVEDIWGDVKKVVRTRHALVEERQRRMDKMIKAHSSPYVDALQLLKKEQHTTDLDAYRKEPVEEEKPEKGSEV